MPQNPVVPATDTASSLARFRAWIGAWQPLTGPGVAAFATASASRVLTFHLLAATGVGVAVAFVLWRAWFPVIDRALPSLPEAASIGSGKLVWPTPDPVRLGQNAWLDLVVHPAASRSERELGQTADLQLDLRPATFRITGAFGHLEQPYAPAWTVDLGRLPASAKWRAWRMPTLILAAAASALGMSLIWVLLASAYAGPAWVVARLMSRTPTLGGAWKVSDASLWVGAAVACAGLAAYATGLVRLPGLAVSQALHVPVAWAWIGWGLLSLPRGSGAAKSRPNAGGNPFART